MREIPKKEGTYGGSLFLFRRPSGFVGLRLGWWVFVGFRRGISFFPRLI